MPFRLSRAGTRRPIPAFLLAAGAALLAVLPAAAQQPLLDATYPQPRLVSVLPAGGKAGTVVEVTFTGIDLEEPEQLLFSHPASRPSSCRRRRPTPRSRPAQAGPKPPVIFKVTIPADVPLGFHDVRLVNKWGVSNARAFVVGDLPEVLEKEPNNDVPRPSASS